MNRGEALSRGETRIAAFDESPDWLSAHQYHGAGLRERRLVPHRSVVHAVRDQALRSPAWPAISEVRSIADEDWLADGRPARQPPRTISYRELHEEAGARARALAAAGVGPAVPVGIQPDNDIESVLTILSVIWLGGTAVLASPRDSAARVSEQFRLVSALDFTELRDRVLAEQARHEGGTLPEIRAGWDEPGVIVFTSGSTGVPRPVGQSNYGIMVNCAGVGRHHQLGSGTKLFGTLPLFHVNALEFTTFGSLVAGSHLFLSDGFNPLCYLSSLARSGAHIASVVPSLLMALLARPSARPDLDSLRYFVSAAAPLAPATSAGVSAWLGKRVVQGYGLSEAANFSCMMPVGLSKAGYARLMTEAEIPPVGQAIEGNEVDVITADGRSATIGEAGSVVIRGHNVMLGYVADPAATAEAFAGGWLHTGDLGVKITDPEVSAPLVVITGRAKNVVKVAGQSVGLEEIERGLMTIPSVTAVAAAGIPDRHSGEALAVLVVAGSSAVDAASVRAAAHQRLGPDFVPKVIFFADAMPLLPNGKLDRSAVARRLSGQCRAPHSR